MNKLLPFSLRTLTIVLIFLLGTLANANASGSSKVREVDVVRVSWQGAEVPTESASELESLINGTVSERWRRYSSASPQSDSKEIRFTHGATLSTDLQLNQAMPCEGSEISKWMRSIRVQFYAALVKPESESRYLVILTPDAGCIWMGRALVGSTQTSGGTIILHNNVNPFVLVHELGHSLGLGHTNLLQCESGVNDGPWGRNCRAVEYGGSIDVMGNVDVDTPLTTYGQWLLGLISNVEIHQSWMNEEIELSASDVAGGIRSIFLRDGKSTYWIEYRRANYEATYKPGLAIFRTDPPPISSILSPNPEDMLSPEFDLDVTRDVWMLNWDNFNYARTKTSGSMTLPEGKTAELFSGNVSISARATKDPNRVVVNIKRKSDVTPPPTPKLTDPNYWGFVGSPIIEPNYDDSESSISGFELDVSGSVLYTPGSISESTTPTYLNPLSPPRTLYLKDLPEGRYRLSVRGIDMWGNKSEWSAAREILVDREAPVLGPEHLVKGVEDKFIRLSWTGLLDRGSKLCKASIQSQVGFVTSSSNQQESPQFLLPLGKKYSGAIEAFDCLGNGIVGKFESKSKFIAANSMKRTGSWKVRETQSGSRVYECSGRCSASTTVRGAIGIEVQRGDVAFLLGGKSVERLGLPVSKQGRFSSMFIGPKSAVLRVIGVNFEISGVYESEIKLGEVTKTTRIPRQQDESLEDLNQRELSLLGINSDDFGNGWQVLPMPRGTTLLDPTLDFCASNYLSDSGRLLRRQVSVTRLNSPYIFLSTEVVKYKSVTAAEAALSELRENHKACVANKGFSENNFLTSYVFQALPKSGARLLDEGNRVIARVTIGSGTSARQLLAFYQFRGDYFTGLYVVLMGEKAISDSEVLSWFDVAEVLADRLLSKNKGS